MQAHLPSAYPALHLQGAFVYIHSFHPPSQPPYYIPHVSSLLLLMNTCAAINPFFMCKSHVRNYLVQLSHMAGEQAGEGTKEGGLKRRRRNRYNFVPGTVKRNPTLFLHKYYRSVLSVRVCVWAGITAKKWKYISTNTHTYSNKNWGIFSKTAWINFLAFIN